MPELYLFGGPNGWVPKRKHFYAFSWAGAGKTTIAMELLPALGCREFLNADAIARALSPFDADAVAFQSGVLLMRRVRVLAESGVDFASESTLAARAWAPFIKRCQTRGYRFNLIFVWLPSSDMAVERVKARVQSGGRDIPEETIRRRYEAGLKNLRNCICRWRIAGK
jgi:predicted ABC-type ATPase